MGVTLYDGSSHAKSAAPAATPSNAPACPTGTAAPAIPNYAYPPGNPVPVNAAPNAIPGGGPVPAMNGVAPTGYWIYQPANPYPVMGPNNVPQVIPVYGPPMNGNCGPAPETAVR